MPTYSYSCTQCGHAFDATQAITAAALIQCPECDGNTLRKVFYPVGVVFKGSGFYRTDSRPGSSSSPPATKTAKADPTPTPAAAAAAAGSGAASGTKSAPKPTVATPPK